MIAYCGPKVAQLGTNIWWRFQTLLVDIVVEFSPKGELVSQGEGTQTITVHLADLDPVTMPETMITPYFGLIQPAEYRQHVQVRFGDTRTRFAQLQNIPQGILDQLGLYEGTAKRGMWPCALLHFTPNFRQELVGMGLASFRPRSDELVQNFTICVHQAQASTMKAWPAWRLGARRLICDADTAVGVMDSPDESRLMQPPPQKTNTAGGSEHSGTNRTAKGRDQIPPEEAAGAKWINSWQFLQDVCVQQCWEGACAPRVMCPPVPPDAPYGPQPSPGNERPPPTPEDEEKDEPIPPAKL
jgi:hypothetical protein